MEKQKYCIRCTTFKDESEFKWRNRAKGWLKPYCIPCNKEYDREHHPNRSPESKTKKKIYKSTFIDAQVEKIVQYMLLHPCVDCNEPDIRKLDFDHLLDKKFNIGNMIGRHPWNKIAEEIVKCEVRCANCHRVITHERANTRKQKLFLKYQANLLDKVHNTVIE